MTCRNHKELMMAYLDNELEDEQRRLFEAHLKDCSECGAELEGFRKLKEMTDDVTLVEPEERLWQQYWSNVYNRTERSIGWILFSVAAILLIIYGGFKAIEEIVENPEVGIFLKVALLALIVGLAVLLVSVGRERLYFWQKDRYKDVRR
ncbi:MAG: anti-sigma factor [Planctomycetota bacterium]|jgi:predicted anti-sigma-YlaC factor YlaD